MVLFILSLYILTINCDVAHLQRLSDEETFKEGDHHGDKPAYRAVFPIGQPVHHGKISRHTTGCNHQYPPYKHKPPWQPSLSALLSWVSTDALFWTGAAVELVSFQAGRREVALQETLHSLNLLHGAVISVWVWKARGSQPVKLLLNVTQLPVEVPAAVVVLLLGFIWGFLRTPPHTVFCPCKNQYQSVWMS